MTKQKRQEPRVVPRAARPETSPVKVLVAAALCLGAGLSVGYYFGRQAPRSASVAPAPAQTAPVANPGSFVQDEANLKAVLASNPRDLHTLIHLGNLYYDHGRHRDAVDYYGRALEIDPTNVNVRTDRGTSFWNLNQPDQAIAEFEKSLQINPTHPQTLYNLGIVYLHGKSDPAQARTAWEKLLATNPSHPDRANIQRQLANLSKLTGASEAAPTTGSPGIQDLMEKLKNR